MATASRGGTGSSVVSLRGNHTTHMDSALFLNPENLGFVEELYERYLENPSSVDPHWRAYFDMEGGGTRGQQKLRPTAKPASIFNPRGVASVGSASSMPDQNAVLAAATRLSRVYQLVNAYRVRGHVLADLDPLDQREIQPHPELNLGYYGFSEADLETLVPSGGFFGPTVMKLGELLEALRETYCRFIGAEFMNIQDVSQKAWLQQRMETSRNRYALERAEQVRILEKLSAAEGLEQFLHTKYVGTKRFSLEGAESLIPMLDLLLEYAADMNVEEVVMGMAHRGRLNVLTNTFNQAPSKLFAKFEDTDPEHTLGSGDVKYHLGYSADVVTRKGQKIHATLCFNPSHLEAVDPVVEGRARAKQDRRGDLDRTRVLPVLVHGDAAFAGQGLVPETLNLAGLPGYRTGGTVHIIVNNQIGFTTSPSSSRSTLYCTDVAKMSQIPIFHVNGEDPEAVAQVVRLAMEYRQTFKKDVVIDMFCYRKYGHNESDEPSFTQPLMYKVIEAHKSVHETYTQRLVETGRITREEASAIVMRTRETLEHELEKIRSERKPTQREWLGGYWAGYLGGKDHDAPDVDTGVALETLQQLSEKLTTVPGHFTPHSKIARLLKQRQAMGQGKAPLDWGMAEHLAFATLLWEERLVRLSGQDSRRGTFSHRHAVLTDVNTGEEFCALNTLRQGQGPFSVYDSSLSEAGVLGFDYGYSLDYPDGLVIWEAQFGDFANGAQVIIDQFICSAEDKWRRLSGIALLLPHGYEGQGPEHSSARLERFLDLCARDNMQVCNASTPAQIFHLLRRQVHRKIRKPLIIMSPKNLLRLPQAVSPLEELTHGTFQRVLSEPIPDPAQVERVVLVSGKFYYEVAKDRDARGLTHLPIVRLEQLYPFPGEQLEALVSQLPNLKELTFAQEEPRNMGALEFVLLRLLDQFGGRYKLSTSSRPEAASPATGSQRAHQIEAKILLDHIFRA
ncbi:MAG: 2-oxoglutarate dehydrogenase E1 component [Myxococcota bacterium]